MLWNIITLYPNIKEKIYLVIKLFSIKESSTVDSRKISVTDIYTDIQKDSMTDMPLR